jgi:hypothetical protein
MKTYGKVTGMVAALAALAVSGIALANHVEGHEPATKEKPKGAPGDVKSKFSIEVENHCTFDASANVLTVKSTIWNQSEEKVTITAAFVDGFQLVPDRVQKNKKTWKDVGTEQYPEDPKVPFSIDPDPEGMNPEEYTVRHHTVHDQ